MPLHAPTGRWKLGLLLAFVTAAFWATLPVALKIAVEVVDPITLTFVRFAFAALAVGAWLAWRGGWRSFRALTRGHWLLLFVAGAMLLGNYVGYVLGLAHTTPANAQLLIQAAPLLMALGGIVVFRERFVGLQWLGLAAVACGLALFSHDQGGRPGYGVGAALILAAALAWAVYALLQKQLLRVLGSAQILAFIYVLATLALLPFARTAQLLELDTAHAVAVLYCALNTLGAYGAFAEALAHWEASRVSVVLATTPVLTVASVEVAFVLWPTLVSPERIAALGWTGAALVVAGSALTSLAAKRPA